MFCREIIFVFSYCNKCALMTNRQNLTSMYGTCHLNIIWCNTAFVIVQIGYTDFPENWVKDTH